MSALSQPDVISVLTGQHREIDRIFAALERIDGAPSQEALVRARQAVMALVQHSVSEEMHLYPAVRRHLDGGNELADRAIAEHDEAEQTMKRLEALRPDEQHFWPTVREMIREVRQHVQEEEHDLFPELQEACWPDELRDLGRRVQRAQRSAPTRPHPASPSEGAALAAAAPGAGLVDRVRDAATGRGG